MSTARNSNRVVVVGAGILGACTANELARQGRPVTVVDRAAPGARTSAAGAGFIALWSAGYAHFWSEPELALQQYGLDFYRTLAAEADIEFRANGNLFVGVSDTGWESYVSPMAEHELAPANLQQLDGAEVSRLTGGMVRAEAVRGGVLHPSGIQIDAGTATRAVLTAAVSAGATLLTERSVDRVLVGDDGRVLGVSVDGEVLPADAVVVAAGAWTNELLATVDIRLPLMPVCASRVVTRSLDVSSTMPTLLFPELGGLWIRERRGGLTYGSLWGYEALHRLNTPLGRRLPEQNDLVMAMIERLSPHLRDVMPALLTAPLDSWIQGLPCHTPDRRFLAGPVPGLKGLYVLAGDNEAGVTHGPGLGRAVSDLLTKGETDITDVSPFRLDRFPNRDWTPEAVAAAMPARR